MTRIDFRDAITLSGVMPMLAGFDPHIVGTPPLGIDLPDSDIAIVCEVHDLGGFSQLLDEAFEQMPVFSLRRRADLNAVVCGFTAHGWAFEIFGQTMPVARQHGWRHFLIEQRLLAMGGETLREAVMALRRTGLKTEPAFARLLGLDGDPYVALLRLEGQDDAALRALLP